jgi:hypothetical protein
LTQLQAAARFGLYPSQFWALAEDDQAYMMALVRVEASMAAWESQEAEREAKRKHKHG